VVIGILIALQINNWNNSQKDGILETKILIQLKEGLTADRSKMTAELKILVQNQKSIKQLKILMEKPKYQ
tara:strand:+ start:2241 stop:2450 length:210 start_codon:yes stop_codon:yes gene_type:complete